MWMKQVLRLCEILFIRFLLSLNGQVLKMKPNDVVMTPQEANNNLK